MASLADMLSVPHEVTHEGEVYKLTPPTQLHQQQFARWLERRAREAVDRAVDLSPEAQAAAQNAVTRDIAADVYAWGGPVCLAALQSATGEGAAKLVHLMLQTHHPGLDEETATKIYFAHVAELARVLDAEGKRDPKALARTLKKFGLPATTSTSSSKTRRSTNRGKRSGK